MSDIVYTRDAVDAAFVKFDGTYLVQAGIPIPNAGGSTSTIALDTDGTPFYSPLGSSAVALDTDGNPYVTDAAVYLTEATAAATYVTPAQVSATYPTFGIVDRNVKDPAYGAKGDGTTDDTAAIQGALTAGGRIYLPRGTYLHTGLTISTAGTILAGPGTLKLKNATAAKTIAVSAANCTIDGITIDGNRTNQTGSTYTAFNLIEAASTSSLTVRRCTLQNGYGNGVALVNTSDSEVSDNVITNVHDNGVQVANVGSDRNRILRNRINGTTAQNGIFLTASGDSSPTANFIYDNVVVGNTVTSCGDTGIETGIHTVRTLVADNTCSASVNPAILIRDCLDVEVRGNTVITDGTMVDGIAAVPQTEAATWDVRSRIHHNRVASPVPANRSSIYVGHAGVTVEDNTIVNTGTIPADLTTLTGRGVDLTGLPSIVRRNRIVGFSYGVDGNNGASAMSVSGYIVEDNHIESTAVPINLYQLSLTKSRIVGNTVHLYPSDPIKFTGTAGNHDTVLARNLFDISGNTVGVYLPIDFLHEGEETYSNVTPVDQYTPTRLLFADSRPTFGILTFGVSGEHGCTFTKIGTTVTFHAKTATINTDNTGFADWAVFLDGNNDLILQRRGASISSIGNFTFSYRY